MTNIPPVINIPTNNDRVARMTSELLDTLREMTPQESGHFVADRMTIMCSAMGICIAEICHGDTDKRFQEAITQAQGNIKTSAERVREIVRQVRN